MQLYLKHLVLRTPLERFARRAQNLTGVWRRWQHPELRDIHLEDHRMHQVMRRIIRHDTNCVDVGCHIGSQLSLLLRLSPHGRHMAFEPVEFKYRWLCKKFPEVDVRCMALSDRDGEVRFWIDYDRPGFSSLACSAGNSRETRVTAARLDTVLPPPRQEIASGL
jgi:FkbM family methyltransferase